jgi:hypothetical protein
MYKLILLKETLLRQKKKIKRLKLDSQKLFALTKKRNKLSDWAFFGEVRIVKKNM